MLLTEDEARKRWCPFAKAPGTYEDHTTKEPGVASFNRNDGGYPFGPCYCLASRCMAWRWINPRDSEKGFCGLSGAPEE